MIDQTEKVTPVWADRVPVWDSTSSFATAWSTITNIATVIFWLKTSDDLVEWATNEYYTTAKAALKANDSEVIHNTGNESWITWNKSFVNDITANAFTWDWSALTGVVFDINAQTEEPAITDGDELVFYDTTATANRKVDFTDLNNALEPSYWKITPWVSTVYASNAVEFWTASSSYVVWRTAVVNTAWTYRVELDMRSAWWWSWEFRWVIDWVVVIPEQTWTNTTDTQIVVNLHIWAEQNLEFQIKQSWWTVATISDVALKYDLVKGITGWSIS